MRRPMACVSLVSSPTRGEESKLLIRLNLSGVVDSGDQDSPGIFSAPSLKGHFHDGLGALNVRQPPLSHRRQHRPQGLARRGQTVGVAPGKID